MATKAERFKASVQRSGPKKPPKPKHIEAADVDDPGSVRRATKRKTKDPEPGPESTAIRNRSVRASKKAEVALEDSATGKPSRKSTRGSANRGKSESQLQRRETRKVTSPAARAKRAVAKTVGKRKKG